jgi:hypothetical protein
MSFKSLRPPIRFGAGPMTGGTPEFTFFNALIVFLSNSFSIATN